jgi:hypothetical protein
MAETRRIIIRDFLSSISAEYRHTKFLCPTENEDIAL